jgi:hypothetical protein
MKRFVALLFVLPLPALAAPADKPRPNTLTPKEAAEGWISLFDGETTYGWHAPNGAKWSVVDGMLYPQAGKPGPLVTTTPFLDYELRFEFQRRPDSKAAVLLGCDREGRAAPGGTVPLNSFGRGWFEGRVQFQGGLVRNVRFNQKGGFGLAFPTPVKAGPPEPVVGHIALSGGGVIFRDIKLRPLNTKPLFNGKDLSGWKVFEGKRSKFSVTKEGWLNVKNGPGDLQTEGLYDDFVLQLECISNGKHLNSGIFFRCIPGKYQQGYEAQIRNQFTDESTQTYTVEDYDPQTHKLLGKRKVKSTAVDYGTGAIYRRVPARRQVARDGEWFTLTVAAHGRHFATWVNGVQVVDWDDNRPARDNGRNGYRAEKGAISIQGHDPTTDLSFRNLRLAELKAEKPKGPPQKK